MMSLPAGETTWVYFLQCGLFPVGGIRERSGRSVQPDRAHSQPPRLLPLQPHRLPAGGAALLHDQR